MDGQDFDPARFFGRGGPVRDHKIFWGGAGKDITKNLCQRSGGWGTDLFSFRTAWTVRASSDKGTGFIMKSEMPYCARVLAVTASL